MVAVTCPPTPPVWITPITPGRMCGKVCPSPPGQYLRQLYFDTMVFQPDQLAFLVEKYGADHILLGTDYPYDMGESDPIGLVARTPGLSDDERAAICGGNAVRLLGLETSG